MPIRNLYLGREAVEGTAAVTRVNVDVEAASINNILGRSTPGLTTGNRVTDRYTRKGGQRSEGSMRIPLMPSQAPLFLQHLLGAPVSVLNAGVTAGAWDHTFKAGGTSIPSFTAQMDHVFTGGSVWREVLGGKFNTMSVEASGEAMPMATLNYIGRRATTIAAPAAIAKVDKAWREPFEAPQGAVLLNNVSYLDLIEITVEVNNSLVPRHSIQPTANVRRLSMGNLVGTFDLTALFSAYAGSLFERFETSGDMDELKITFSDTAVAIGTGATPPNPAVAFTLHKPLILEGSLDATDVDTDQSISGRLGYANTPATNITVTVTNDTASYAGS